MNSTDLRNSTRIGAAAPGDVLTGGLFVNNERAMPMRVYEVAKEIGIANKDLVDKIRSLGIEVKNHMSTLDVDAITRVRRALEKEKSETTVTERIQGHAVIRRRSQGGTRTGAGEADDALAVAASSARAAEATGSVMRRTKVAVAAATGGAASAHKEADDHVSESRFAPPPEVAKEPAVVRRAKAPVADDLESDDLGATKPATKPAAAVETQAAPVASLDVSNDVSASSDAKEKIAAAAAAQAAVTASARTAQPNAAETGSAARATEQDASAQITGPAKSDSRESASAETTAVASAVPTPVARPDARTGEFRKLPARPSRFEPGKMVEATQLPVAAAPPAPEPVFEEPDMDGPIVDSSGEPVDEATASIIRADALRARFEEELARARETTKSRQKDFPGGPPEVVVLRPVNRDPNAPVNPNRPAVGTIIELKRPKIQITERAPTRAAPGRTTAPASPNRGKWEQQQRAGGMRGRRNEMMRKAPRGRGGSTMLTTPAEHKRVIKIEEVVSVSDLARYMGIKSNEVLKKLWSMGMMGVTLNHSIDFETASLLAGEFGYEVQNTAFQEEHVISETTDLDEDLVHRAPVVTVMGHVDHGKTSLLDAIRSAKVAAGESGGITQHIGAYRVSAAGIGDVVFLDTPGHEAFTAMRARGAQATDIVVLVCAADDGPMPQTIEALNHAKDAKVPVVVAVNKIDKVGANPDRVRSALSEHGLIPEEWGGTTQFINVSAHTKVGLDALLKSIHVQAEVLELRANPAKLAKGIVIEAKLDKNRGPTATVLVQDGTLSTGDIIVVGEYLGRVRAMLNDLGQPVKTAGPSTPVEIIGIDGVPEAGDTLNAVSNEKSAKTVIEHRRDTRRRRELAHTGKVTLENILEQINAGDIKELKIVLKADVQGSAEAVKASLIKQSTAKVKVNVIQAGVGGITETDVNLAKAGGAIIIGFHVRPAGKATMLAEHEGVDIKLYNVIYEALDDVKKAMAGLLAPIRREKPMGVVEIREVYHIPKIGAVGGAAVTEGKVTRQAHIRVVRESIQVHEGKLASLKRFKDDVREVVQGYECGLSVDNFNDLKVGDRIEAYEIVEESATL